MARTKETIFKTLRFYNKENGFFVLVDENEEVFTGYSMYNPNSYLNIPVVVKYEHKIHKRHGLQFEVKEIKTNIPPLFHFLTEIIKGVKKSAAIELAKKFKNINNLEKALKENERDILQIKGIGKKSIEKLKNGLKKDKELYKLAEILLPYGVSPNIIKKIYANFRNNSVIKELKKDPYAVLTSIKGIGFKKADEIALKAKLVEVNSIQRAKAAIKYTFFSIMEDNGDTVLSKEEVKKNFFELVKEFSDEDFEKAFKELDNTIEVVDEKNNTYSLSTSYYMEKFIFNFVNKENFSFVKNSEEIIEFTKQYEQENNLKLGDEQREAIIKALTTDSSTYIIAGYAGTGKTTTAKAIVEFLKKQEKNIVGCALSGAAANRLKSVSGIAAYTIHTLLGYRDGEFKYNKDNKLQYDLIIIDEASMVSGPLFYHLMQAVDTNRTKIIMLGDDAQLPPIGWGEVFANLLEYEKLPKTKLTKIYRQSDDKVITTFANTIRKGEVPKEYNKNKYKDFKFVPFNIKTRLSDLSQEKRKEFRDENNLKIKHFILENFKRYKDNITESLKLYKETKDPKHLKRYINRIQLLTPVKAGILGTLELNTEIKNILNPADENSLKIINKSGIARYISTFDKVIHLKNIDMFCNNTNLTNIQKVEKNITRLNTRVFNGQVGVVTNILKDEENTYIEVFYPNEEYFAYYYKEDFEEEIIDLSYSITIHKSQGQEYESVVIPVTFSHFTMLNAKLLYTAITRAKERVHIIGEERAFHVACKKLEEIHRNTNLKYFISQENSLDKEKKIAKKNNLNFREI